MGLDRQERRGCQMDMKQGRGRAALRPGFLKRAPVRLKLRGAQI